MKKWQVMSNKEKGLFVFKVFCWVVAAVLVVLYFTLFSQTSGGLNAIGTWLDAQAPLIYQAIVYIIVAVVVSKLLRFILTKALRFSNRGVTIAKLMDSFIKYLTAVIVVVMVLLSFGVNSVALFASLGILGLVIGLAAQSLISDIISGLFIVFENEFEVGDYIVIDGFRGKVLSIGLRTTQMVDYGGNNKIINNSEIRTLINLSHDLSLFSVEVKVKHEDFTKAEAAIIANIDKIAKEYPDILYGPLYKGVSGFSDFGPELKVIAKSDEENRFQSERDLRRAVKVILDEAGIEIALPKVFIEDVSKK